MAAPSKAQLLNEVHTLLKKRYPLEPRTERPSVFEAIVYGILHEGATREQANQVLNRFRDDYFDWNEVRVSSIDEIKNALAGIPDAENRANKIRRFLRQLFDHAITITGLKSYEFALDPLAKKPLKESVKALQEFEALGSDYVLATVTQMALGGHAMPVDASIRRGLERLEVIEDESDDATVRAMLERAVPKNRGVEFIDLMEELTHDTCVAGPPDCPRCELKKICPTGIARPAGDKPGVKITSKGKPSAMPVAVPTPPAKPEPAAKSDKSPKGRTPRPK